MRLRLHLRRGVALRYAVPVVAAGLVAATLGVKAVVTPASPSYSDPLGVVHACVDSSTGALVRLAQSTPGPTPAAVSSR